jgi:hypothetical protein
VRASWGDHTELVRNLRVLYREKRVGELLSLLRQIYGTSATQRHGISLRAWRGLLAALEYTLQRSSSLLFRLLTYFPPSSPPETATQWLHSSTCTPWKLSG